MGATRKNVATNKPAATHKAPRKSAAATKTTKAVKSVPVAKKAASAVKAVLDQENAVVATQETQATQPLEVKATQETKATSETKATKPSTRAKRAPTATPALAGAVPTPSSLLAERIAMTGLTENAFARAIGVYPRRIAEILAGNRRLTADTALRLARYFGDEPMHWMNLQAFAELQAMQAELATELAEIKPFAAKVDAKPAATQAEAA